MVEGARPACELGHPGTDDRVRDRSYLVVAEPGGEPDGSSSDNACPVKVVAPYRRIVEMVGG